MPRLSKKVLEKLKFFEKNQVSSLNRQSKKPLYTQASKNNIKEIIKIKNVFSKLSTDKVSKFHKVINNSSQKDKQKLNIAIKNPLRKQIIISIGFSNSKRVMTKFNAYISNINRLLKKVKSEISINFIQSDDKELLLTTNKVTDTSDLNIIKKYLKELNNIDHSKIMSPRLSQSNLYLKILSISYFVKDTNLLIFPNIVNSIIKSMHIFNNIVLAFYSHIIKASPNLDIIVI